MNAPWRAGVLVLAGVLAGPARAAPEQTSPELTSPESVIARQIELLERAGWGEPGAFAQAYALTTRRHQALTGPLARFVRTLYRVYTPLLEPHTGLDFFPLRRDGDMAEQRVTVRLEDGVEYDYVFRVRRGADPRCPACWYIDGIYEVDPYSPNGLQDGQLV